MLSPVLGVAIVSQFCHTSDDRRGASPSAGKRKTHVCEHERRDKTKALVENVAYELSVSNYGPKEWWVLLQKV